MPKPRFPARHPGRPPTRQRGAVLIIALIFLILITLLAISASSSSLLQQKMVAATRNGQLALWAADSTLRGVEWRLFTTADVAGGHLLCTTSGVSAGSNGGCVRYNSQSTLFQSGGQVYKFKNATGWLASAGRAYDPPTSNYLVDPGSAFGSDFNMAKVAVKPRYMIEDLGPVRPPGAGPSKETGTTGLAGGSAAATAIHIYRITVRSTGATKNVVRVVQSTFSAQANN